MTWDHIYAIVILFSYTRCQRVKIGILGNISAKLFLYEMLNMKKQMMKVKCFHW